MGLTGLKSKAALPLEAVGGHPFLPSPAPQGCVHSLRATHSDWLPPGHVLL